MQSGYGHQRLEGGGGHVGALGGPVQQGIGGVCQQGIILRAVVGGIVGGIGGQGQHLAGAHLDHGGAGAPGLVAVLGVHVRHGLGQGLLHRLLEGEVDGQLHGVAGLGGLFVVLAGDLAGGVGGDDALAVRAPEVLLKGGLHAEAADAVVAAVSLLFQGIIFFLIDEGDGAQKLGGVGSLVLPDGGGGDLGAGVVSVVEQGDHLRVDVLCHGVGGGVHQLPDGQLIAHTDDTAGLIETEGDGHLKFLPHPLHHGVGGKAQGGEVVGSDVLCLGVLRHHLQLIPQKGGEAVALGIVQLGQGGEGIGKGGGLGNGQVVHPGNALALAQLHQTQNGFVFVLALGQGAGVEGQVVGRAAGHHLPAAAVCDDAPGGLHGLLLGNGADGLGQVVVVLVDLDVVQHADVHHQRQPQQGGEHVKADIALRIFALHGVLLSHFCGPGDGRPGTKASPEWSKAPRSPAFPAR